VDFLSSPAQYDRFMGRYTAGLAPALADAAGVVAGMRVLDVGCGPGGLTAELAARVGAQNVAAIDPASQFVAACRERIPGADAREGTAEALPWDDDSFDAALSSLVIAFMADPDQGVREMARVTRPGGVVAICMWDLDGHGMEMLDRFWTAARKVAPGLAGERMRPGGAEGDIADRMRRAGLTDVADGALEARVEYTGFADFWEPLTYGVGPAGQYVAALDDGQRTGLRDLLREDVPDRPFAFTGRAWYARGTVA
jgi:SAM-dependent methyltransferase